MNRIHPWIWPPDQFDVLCQILVPAKFDRSSFFVKSQRNKFYCPTIMGSPLNNNVPRNQNLNESSEISTVARAQSEAYSCAEQWSICSVLCTTYYKYSRNLSARTLLVVPWSYVMLYIYHGCHMHWEFLKNHCALQQQGLRNQSRGVGIGGRCPRSPLPPHFSGCRKGTAYQIQTAYNCAPKNYFTFPRS